jgi:uncharacterized Ntn-hydrolase superfamily protein
MPAKKPPTIKDRLKAAKLPERSVQVCLRGDLAAEFDELERRLAAVRAEERAGGDRPSSQRMGQKSEAVVLAEKLTALRRKMAEEMLDIRVRALPRAEWQRHVREHPPQKGDEGDEAMGVDFNALMAVVTPLCIVEPEMDDEDWAALDSVLSSADYDRIMGAVWEVNRTGVDLPKSRLASLVMAENAAG